MRNGLKWVIVVIALIVIGYLVYPYILPPKVPIPVKPVPSYDQVLNDTFNTWKEAGVGENAIYAILSESNGNAYAYDAKHPEPVQFVNAVNRVAVLLKSALPASQPAVLLDMSTQYPKDHWSFDTSLIPYVTALDGGVKTLIIEGFPRADEGLVDAAVFLNATKIVEVARTMKATKLIFNTGTAGNYRGYESNLVERQAILNSEYDQIILAKKMAPDLVMEGFVFTQDKSQLGERVDWSYTRSPNDFQLLKVFTWKLAAHGIKVSFFDPDRQINVADIARDDPLLGNTEMIFMGLYGDPVSAGNEAQRVAVKMGDIAGQGKTPLVVIEPVGIDYLKLAGANQT